MTSLPLAELWSAPDDLLPPNIAAWFAHRGWTPHAHQMAMMRAAADNRNVLLVAPTGAGKTLSGFLPSLADLAERPRPGLHTLYISPLKALAVDIQRNLETPIAELRLPIRAETRTGDTPQPKRERQRKSPPNILMTTPESLALMLSYPDAADIFGGLKTIVIDELHAVAGTKRGDLLSLGIARLRRLAPWARAVGLSATVADPPRLAAYLSPTARSSDVTIIRGRDGAKPVVDTLITRETLPWAGHMAVHAMAEVYERIAAVNTAIVFVNTRAQAELCFQALWRFNSQNLPIGIHHGSLEIGQRRKVEAAMARGELRAVVATSSLDLGIDWGSVDLVVQVGAPKGASRLIQRIGRANHRLDEPSVALLVPGNRFEYLECRAAADAVAEKSFDGDPVVAGGLDVLAQHILGMGCSAPFTADALYAEVISAAPYAELARKDFDDTLNFVATGGYALGAYERYRRLKFDAGAGEYSLANAHVRQQYRMNIGTIVEATTLKVRLGRGRVLGEVEEYFANGLVPGDTFIFGGRLLKFIAIQDNDVVAADGGTGDPKVPAYAGGRMPLTTHLAERVRDMLASPGTWRNMPPDVREWLELQRWASVLPDPHGLLVESFPRQERQYMVAYCFEGRNAHQTLGMLLTRRMERLGLKPLGFVATDYVLGVWSLKPVTEKVIGPLFDEDMLGDDLEAWMEDSSLLKRTFRNVAVIAGLIERNHPGEKRKNTRQVTFSSDLIYEVLKRHEPDHILLRATRADAARGLTDIRRLADLLARTKDRITLKALDRVSPLAVPVLLEIGRESVWGEARDHLLAEAEEELVREAMGRT
jgi:ATP-dependent Lhr-like helicase